MLHGAYAGASKAAYADSWIRSVSRLMQRYIIPVKAQKNRKNQILAISVSKRRFELPQPFGHYPLKVACLPISPPGQLVCLVSEDCRRRAGAKNGTRTRDPDLGKVVLYQLSYFRIVRCNSLLNCGAKLCTFIHTSKFLMRFFENRAKILQLEKISVRNGNGFKVCLRMFWGG